MLIFNDSRKYSNSHHGTLNFIRLRHYDYTEGIWNQFESVRRNYKISCCEHIHICTLVFSYLFQTQSWWSVVKILDNEGSLMSVNENSVRKLTVMLIKMYNTHARKKFLEKRARIMSRVIASRTSILRT